MEKYFSRGGRDGTSRADKIPRGNTSGYFGVVGGEDVNRSVSLALAALGTSDSTDEPLNSFVSAFIVVLVGNESWRAFSPSD